jgi:hypothetical protein
MPELIQYKQGNRQGSSGYISPFQDLIQELQKQQESANLANEKRYGQMMAIYDEAIGRYQPGGSFETEALRQLEVGKGRAIGKETQDLISSGLFGTTTKAALGGKWEEQVGAPSRLKLEDIMMQRLTAAQLGKAGAIERREDVGPGYDLIAQLASQYGQGAGGGYMSSAQPYRQTINRAPGAYYPTGPRSSGGPSTQYRAPFSGTGPTPGGSGGGATSTYTPVPKAGERTGGWTKSGTTQKAYWGGKGDYAKWASEMQKLGWSPPEGTDVPSYTPKSTTKSTWDATNYPWL